MYQNQFTLTEVQIETLSEALWRSTQQWFGEDETRGMNELFFAEPEAQEFIHSIRLGQNPNAKQTEFVLSEKDLNDLDEQVEMIAPTIMERDEPMIVHMVALPAFQEILAQVALDAWVEAEAEKENAQA